MNKLQRTAIRGLYKEAGIPEILNSLKNAATNVKDFAVDTYNKNPEAWNRASIDATGVLTMMGLGRTKDAIQGKKTSLLDYLTYGGIGFGAAEAGQWGWRKYQDLNKKLGETSADRDALRNTNEALNNSLKSQARELAKANDLNNQNVKTIDSLDNQLKASEATTANLNKQLEDLNVARNTEVGTRDAEISNLNKQLGTSNKQVEDLTNRIGLKDQEIANTAIELNNVAKVKEQLRKKIRKFAKSI